MHVDEDFAQASITIFAGVDIDLVAAHDCLLGVTLAAVGHAFTLAVALPFDDTLDDLFGHRRDALGERSGGDFGHIVLVFILIGEERGIERLGEL